MRRALPTLLALLSVTVAAPTATAAPEQIPFPILGGATYYEDDYGDPRGQGRHEGNDLMAPRGTPVIAVADGVVKLHESPRSGPMLYLTSRSREYLYIHLSNDRTAGNDNRGGADTAYAPGLTSGARVRAGQVIGYVGNSGDADAGAPHLHFEVHDLRGGPTNPYPLLRAAPVTFVAVPAGSAKARQITASEPPGTLLSITGTLLGVNGDRVAIRARTLRCDDPASRPLAVRRLVVLQLTPGAAASLAGLAAGTQVWVTTEPTVTTRAHRMLFPGAWAAAAGGPATP